MWITVVNNCLWGTISSSYFHHTALVVFIGDRQIRIDPAEAYGHAGMTNANIGTCITPPVFVWTSSNVDFGWLSACPRRISFGVWIILFLLILLRIVVMCIPFASVRDENPIHSASVLQNFPVWSPDVNSAARPTEGTELFMYCFCEQSSTFGFRRLLVIEIGVRNSSGHNKERKLDRLSSKLRNWMQRQDHSNQWNTFEFYSQYMAFYTN